MGGLAIAALPRRVPNASGWGTKVAVTHEWVDGLCHPSCMGGPQHLKARDKISSQCIGYITPAKWGGGGGGKI